MREKGAIPSGAPRYSFDNSSTMSCSKLRGFVGGPYLLTGFPSLLQRNLVKFHFMEDPRVPVSSFLKYKNRGCAFFPLTSILSNILKVAPLERANSLISSFVPGSWLPN